MESLLQAGEKIKDYRVSKFIKTSANGQSESYYMVNSSGERALLKLFKEGYVDQILEYTTRKVFTNPHSHFAEVVDSGDLFVDGRYYPYIIRSLFEGQRISDIIATGKRYKWAEAKGIIYQVLEALRSLHFGNGGIIHNDITARNVVITEHNGCVKVGIIGMGHMSAVTDSGAKTVDGGVNIIYRAPETFKGVYNRSTDVFSVGVLLYTMLMGKEPWSIQPSFTSPEINRIVLRTERRRCENKLLKGLPLEESQARVLGMMLALDPKERFKNAEDALRALTSNRFTIDSRNIEPLTADKKQEKRGESSEAMERVVSQLEELFDAERVEDDEDEVVVRKGFDRVAGLEDVKEMFRRNVIYTIKNPEKAARYRIKQPNGVLLYGPPGCGKTFIAEVFAEEVDLHFEIVKASDLGSQYIHGTQEKISELFQRARANAPAVICFDEFDAFVPSRGKVNSELIAGEVNEFLCQLNNCSKNGIFIIGTTNRPEMIDPAALRTGRLDKIFYIPMPDERALKELYRINLAGRPVAKDVDYDELARRSKGFAASDIAYIVDESALTACMSESDITQGMLLRQIMRTPSSITKEELEKFEELRKKYGDRRSRAEVEVSEMIGDEGLISLAELKKCS